MGNITSIAAVVDDRLSVFKPEIVAELGESFDSAAKKLKLMDQPQIKSEGNKSGPRPPQRRINILSSDDEQDLLLPEGHPDKCDLLIVYKGGIVKEGSFTQSEGVQGNLKPCFEFWQNTLNASRFVCDVIDRGYMCFRSSQFRQAHSCRITSLHLHIMSL